MNQLSHAPVQHINMSFHIIKSKRQELQKAVKVTDYSIKQLTYLKKKYSKTLVLDRLNSKSKKHTNFKNRQLHDSN